MIDDYPVSASPPHQEELTAFLAHRFGQERQMLEQLRDPGLSSVRRCLRLVFECLQELDRRAGITLTSEQEALLLANVLERSFGVFRALCEGETTTAARRLVAQWRSELNELGLVAESDQIAEPAAAYAPSLPTSAQVRRIQSLRVIFLTGVVELLVDQGRSRRTRDRLRRLMVHLSLGQDDAGRAFGVSGETIRRWEQGKNRPPEAKEAELSRADAALTRLLGLFRPESLAAVLRRPADLFAGESALDWILRGRIAEVAERYEAALVYQG